VEGRVFESRCRVGRGALNDTGRLYCLSCAAGIAPFPGAATGIGGRIRDGHATGTGSLIVGSTAGYCVGNLNLPGYELPWEDASMDYPPNLAPPKKIIIDGSNGCSAYGNSALAACLGSWCGRDASD
jgi:phosphoribosylformylglycinamidine synthase